MEIKMKKILVLVIVAVIGFCFLSACTDVPVPSTESTQSVHSEITDISKETCPFTAGFEYVTIKDRTYYLLDYNNKIMVRYSRGSEKYSKSTIAGTLTNGVYITDLETYTKSETYYKESKINGTRYVVKYQSDGSYKEYDLYSIMSEGDISTAWGELKKNTDYLQQQDSTTNQ